MTGYDEPMPCAAEQHNRARVLMEAVFEFAITLEERTLRGFALTASQDLAIIASYLADQIKQENGSAEERVN